ncbi:MAG TPA: ArsB/NhaD family transporter [Pantanalinema sp.]
MAYYFSVALLALCILLIVVRPFRLPVVAPPLAGAAVLMASGLAPLSAIATVWGLVWDATLTLLGLMVISLVLDRAGFFAWCARRIAQASGGDGRRAWWGLMLLAWATTAVLANDGAMLILVPIYAELLLKSGATRAQAYAYLFPVGFLIDVASTPLVTSNLTNIMAADYFRIGFGEYARMMAVPSLVLGLASLGFGWLAFRSQVPERLALEAAAPRRPAGPMFAAGWAALAALGLGFGLAHAFHWPVCWVVGAVALGLLALGLASGQLALIDVPRLTPWDIPVFALSLFVMVEAVARTGGQALLAAGWLAVDPGLRPLAVGGSIAALAAGLNNLPALLLGLLSFQHAPEVATPAAIAASVVGANVAPKLTPYGSLATLLWMGLLGAKGFRVGWGEYLRYGLLLTPPVLALGLLAAWLCS